MTPFKQMIRLRVLPVIALIVTLLVGLNIVNNHHDLWKKEQAMLMSELVSSQRSAIQHHLSRSLSSTYLLKALIEIDHGNTDNFTLYAKNIITALSDITYLQLAPDGIITHSYPLEGHEKAIGYNIFTNTSHRKATEQAIREEKLFLIGPFELMQGGIAIIGRNPVYLKSSTGEKQFWGFVSALTYIDDLIAATDLKSLSEKGYHYQLANVSEGNEHVFAQSSENLPSSETIIQQEIEVPNGTWLLSMGVALHPWHHISMGVQILLVICLSLLIGYITYILLKQPTHLQQLVEEKTQALHKLAFYDPLTKLCNRRLFNDLLARMAAANERTDSKLALLYLDLDDFKRINDSFGHENGDQLLKVIGQRLTSTVRKSDIVARIGGDEFCVLLPSINGRDAAAQIAEKILDVVEKPIKLGSHSVRITPSIGITLAPDDGSDATQLLKNADIAMYSAKENSRDNYQFFEDKLNTNTLERLILEREIIQAVENKEFTLNFQPQICLASNNITGIEALVRWEHPSRGRLGPGEFIQVAEDSRLIIPLGTWILEQSCRQLQQLNRPELHVAVNLSPRQFADPDLLDTIKKALDNSGLEGNRLELEITETALMKNMEKAVDTLKQIKKLGVLIAIDDFGTGYSSLSQLKNLPADILKIDQAFMKDITESKDNAVIADVIINVGHKLGLSVIAEGIETQEQLDFITKMQCDMAQGYFFSHPLNIEQLNTLLDERDKAAH